MPMTLDQLAIRKSIDLWQYLEETGATTKMTAYAALEFNHDYLDCPLCEYASSLTPSEEPLDCYSCPAVKQFASYIKPGTARDSTCYCERSTNSPWWKWLSAAREEDTIGCKKHAGEMVEMLKALGK